MRLYHILILQFQRIEILPEHAGGFGDGDECSVVNLLDDARDAHLVATVGNDEQHVALLPVVGPVAFEEGGPAMQFLIDAARNLVIFFGENHKLVGLMEAVDHRVSHQHAHKEHHEAIDQFLHIVKNEKRRSHDNEIAHHIDFAVGNVPIFTDHQGDDVEAAGIATPVDGDAGAERAQRGADNDAHEHIIHNGLREDTLADVEKHGDDDGANQRVDAEFRAKHFPGDGDEDGIEGKCREADRDSRGEEEDGGDTCHATARHLKGSHKCGPSEHKNCQTEGNEEVVFYFFHHIFECHRHYIGFLNYCISKSYHKSPAQISGKGKNFFRGGAHIEKKCIFAAVNESR